ncbi:MAG: hypothetical protein INR72_19950 [Williamsia herbipolensis]|nr:hypothetical protein [Williamsia herbipolensis]
MIDAQAGDEAGRVPAPDPEAAHCLPPGGPAAAGQGCCCSVLANATYRAGVPDVEPLIDPTCPLHLAGTASGALTARVASSDPVPSPVPVPGSVASTVTAPIPVIASTSDRAGSAAA